MWTGSSGRLLDSELACYFKTGMKDTATSCITARCKGIGVQIAEWLSQRQRKKSYGLVVLIAAM